MRVGRLRVVLQVFLETNCGGDGPGRARWCGRGPRRRRRFGCWCAAPLQPVHIARGVGVRRRGACLRSGCPGRSLAPPTRTGRAARRPTDSPPRAARRSGRIQPPGGWTPSPGTSHRHLRPNLTAVTLAAAAGLLPTCSRRRSSTTRPSASTTRYARESRTCAYDFRERRNRKTAASRPASPRAPPPDHERQRTALGSLPGDLFGARRRGRAAPRCRLGRKDDGRDVLRWQRCGESPPGPSPVAT